MKELKKIMDILANILYVVCPLLAIIMFFASYTDPIFWVANSFFAFVSVLWKGFLGSKQYSRKFQILFILPLSVLWAVGLFLWLSAALLEMK